MLVYVKDTMKSTKWMVEAILKAELPVLLYQGVYDAKDGPASSEAWMRAVAWDHIANFWKAERGVWKVKGKLAGYWRSWKNLTQVVVQGAGHQVSFSHLSNHALTLNIVKNFQSSCFPCRCQERGKGVGY